MEICFLKIQTRMLYQWKFVVKMVKISWMVTREKCSVRMCCMRNYLRDFRKYFIRAERVVIACNYFVLSLHLLHYASSQLHSSEVDCTGDEDPENIKIFRISNRGHPTIVIYAFLGHI